MSNPGNSSARHFGGGRFLLLVMIAIYRVQRLRFFLRTGAVLPKPGDRGFRGAAGLGSDLGTYARFTSRLSLKIPFR